ncbi:MAG: SGNH hydrolase domain-containing protein [Dermabacter sp.]|nr:SGNH hydrolase domain-containing protein [Dermabacter sp.]
MARRHTHRSPEPGDPTPEPPSPSAAPSETAPGSTPGPSSSSPAPTFALDDFVQDSPNGLDAFVQGPEPAEAADDFSWFQDALEQESEDIAAWGSGHDTTEPFVWFQGPAAEAEAPHEGPTDTPTGREGSRGTATAPARRQEPAQGREAAPSRGAAHFRPEIEGLRAVAVLMIVAYHVWLGRVSGGVDVFLFISAFLLGSSFARRLDAGSPFAPVRYWLRTFTRLMPPATIAILGTLVATFVLLPPSAWQNVIDQAIASALYVQNLFLSSQAVDYYALDASTASPLQHFWSLSLQGQVFLVWPLLFILAAALAKGRRHPRRIALAVFGVIAAASFAYSVWFTGHAQSAAYFSTLARAWEVALGTILALALPRLDQWGGAHRPGAAHEPRHRTLRAVAGWLGFALLVSLGLLLDVQGMFPGWIALWPLAGASLIILAGYSGSRWGFDRILTMRLPRALASSSYSLYLVHWPLLIFWLASVKSPRAGFLDGLAVILASLFVAWLLSKAVDAQFRRPAWKSAPVWRSLAVILTCLALVLGGAFGWRAYLGTQSTSAPITVESTPEPTPNPREETFAASALSPKGYELYGQWPNLPYMCAGQEGAPAAHDGVPCETLLPIDADSDYLVLVVGSSHARQYLPTLLDAARDGKWQIINLSMDGCGFVAGDQVDERCADYYDYALGEIDRLNPDLVVTTPTLSQADSADETVPAGAADALQAVLDRGVSVLAFRDSPRWPTNMYECAEAVIESGGDDTLADAACGASVSDKLAATSPLTSLETMTGPGSRVVGMDLTDEICPDGRCSPIVGTAFVYMDDNHLSKVFTTSLSSRVHADLRTRLPEAASAG